MQMNNSLLRNLLNEYSQKRLAAQIDADNAKNEIYSKFHELQDIDNKLKQTAFSTITTILNTGDSSPANTLKKQIEDLKKRKAEILKINNIPADYLEPKYECKICNDTGFVNNSSSLCNCIKQKMFNIEYNKSNIGNLDTDNFNNFNFDLYSDEVNFEKYNSNISPRDNMKNITKIVNHFISNFDNSEEKNLLFSGKTGLGKTFLSNCIANQILRQNKTVLYQTASVMLDTIIDYRFGKENVSNTILDSILNVDLLIIDDLGTESINSLKFTELFNVINTRLLNQNHHITKTIISTNLNLQELFSTYDERIVSRFVGSYNICKFFGEDIRFKNR